MPAPSPPLLIEGSRIEALRRYLETEFDAAVTSVVVDNTTVVVRGVMPRVSGLALVEWPMELSVADAFADRQTTPFLSVTDIQWDEQGRFEVSLPRFVSDGEVKRDRVYGKWAIAQAVSRTDQPSADPADPSATRWIPISHARAFDRVVPRAIPEWPELRGRKGLGAWGPGRPEEDLDLLGVSGVTVNILLDTFIASEPGPGRTAFESAGRTWYANDNALERLDQTLLAAARRDLLVSVIILVRQANACADRAWGTAVAHPAATPDGIFVMPNVESREGIAAYVAALELLAERYTRPDNSCGRIHHWIMHNEVNSGWVWTNAGRQSTLGFTDLFHRSIRLTHAVIRQYDPRAQVFVSLDHHWTSRHNEHCFGARSILETLLAISAREGDFDWAVAHHPYPQNLFEPRTWRDDHATPSFDTEKITYRNLEVLDAWLARPQAWFNGERPRRVHLTEQGLNSPSYSESDLLNQAAGMAYVWHKLEGLDTIELFHYHNWVDNRHEGGLRIGLRRFPDDEAEPLGKKPIWYVYQALETDRQAEATAFALDVIGIGDWSEIKSLPVRAR
ncbi:MAG: DUF5722 domain-containing protein [Pirellulaceae bacterium]